MAMSRAKIIKSVWREFTLVQALFVIFIGRKPATEMEHRRCRIEVAHGERVDTGRQPASEMKHQRCGIELSTAEYKRVSQNS